MKSKLIVAIALSIGTLSSGAFAEEPAKARAPAAKRGEITLEGLIITLKPPRPVAAVDVARLTPKLTLAELRQPLLQRIEAAIENDPF